MSIISVFLDESDDECISCCLCADVGPHVFEVPDKMKVKENINFDEFDAEIRNATDSCPTSVIKFEEVFSAVTK